MSGHSKWASIKHKKAKTDAARGKIFTRLIKEITVAARVGGGDEDGNPRLRTAVLAGKAANMPAANIERAIKKGTGELPGVVYEEIVYEGYGPAGVALLIDCVTDSKNRTVADVRHILSKHHGSMASAGSVAFNFDKKGLVVIENPEQDEDTLLELVLDHGAEDIVTVDGNVQITTAFTSLNDVSSVLDANNIAYASANPVMIPKSTVKLEQKAAEQVLRLMDALEEHDDIQDVHANFDIDDEVLQNL
jgi:YebC/PmpR family DNA-binding regulatory protein